MPRSRPATHFPSSIAATLAFGVAAALGPIRVIESRLAATAVCGDDAGCAPAPPDFLPRATGELRLLAEVQADGLRLLLWIAFAFSVLLVAGVAVNLATLALARASARRPEIALRAALGADPWGLIGKLLGEALRIALPGVVVGAALGAAGALLLDATWPVDDAGGTGTGGAGVVHRVVPAALAAVVLLTWLSPARPAWARDLRRWLAAASPGTVGPMGTAVRDLLVVLQVAGSVLLLVSAGILLRGYGPVDPAAASPAFDPHDTVALRLRIGGAEAVSGAGRAAAYEQVLERVRALPEVVDTSLATEGAWLGLGVQDQVTTLCLECYLGQDPKQMARGTATLNAVSPGYFAAAGISVLEGREFEGTDRHGAAPVALVSRAFAYRLFPNGKPTVRRSGSAGWMETGTGWWGSSTTCWRWPWARPGLPRPQCISPSSSTRRPSPPSPSALRAPRTARRRSSRPWAARPARPARGRGWAARRRWSGSSRRHGRRCDGSRSCSADWRRR